MQLEYRGVIFRNLNDASQAGLSKAVRSKCCCSNSYTALGREPIADYIGSKYGCEASLHITNEREWQVLAKKAEVQRPEIEVRLYSNKRHFELGWEGP